jgi:transcriptional regulator with XRE-family HTH domain
MTTRGERLAAYLAKLTGGRRGWQTKLVKESGVKRQTITKWTHPKFDRYPDLETLATLATALGVRPYELVAAMDGDAGEPTEEMVRRVSRQEATVLFQELSGTGQLRALPGGRSSRRRGPSPQ